MVHRQDKVRWLSWGSDPGILVPFNRYSRHSFVRLVWGSPFIRPVSFGLANPWSGWRLFTIRLPWVILPFVSLRLGQFLLYFGGKTYRPTLADAKGHTYARPDEFDKLTITASSRWGREPLS